MINPTIDNIKKVIEENGFRTRVEVTNYFGVHRKYKPILRLMNENNLLIREHNPEKNEENARKEIIKVKNHLNKIPTIEEFNTTAKELGLYLRSDMIRKNIYKKKWAEIMEDIFGEGSVPRRMVGLSDEELLQFIRNFVSENKRLPLYEDFNKNTKYPSYDTIRNRFGNLTKAIELANVEDSFRKLKFGTIISYKGKVFKSHKEYQIGKALIDNNIPFEYEVPYEIGNHTFDFYIDKLDLYIEYYGLYEKTEEYTEHTEYKRSLYDGKRVLELFPKSDIQKIMDTVVKEFNDYQKFNKDQ